MTARTIQHETPRLPITFALDSVLSVQIRACEALPEDALKTLFLSLLAFQPAAKAIEIVLFNARRLLHGSSMEPVGARKSAKLIGDCSVERRAFWIADRADETGHHRYYGRSAYP